MADEIKTCDHCNHWQPRYFGIGTCTAANMPNAKFWALEGKDLLTVASFGCQSFAKKQDHKQEVI